MINMMSDGFKGFVFKWGHTCLFKKLSCKTIDKKQIALINGTSGTQRKDPALSTEMVMESFEGSRTLSSWVFKEGLGFP